MVQIGNVPEIIEVKDKLSELKEKGVIKQWELPYENLLTRRDAAIFFLTPAGENNLEEVWGELGKIPKFTYRENTERKLSQLQWRVEFNKEDEEQKKAS